MKLVTKLKLNISNHLPLILVLFLAFLLRFVNLGYSDLQGDEIRALLSPDFGQTVWQFLLSQRKGPLQFVVTYLIGFFDPIYENEAILRIPFALSGFFSIYFFYEFVRIWFGRKVAFYSSLVLSLNGFLIAFSRIVQYQSLVIFFMFLSLYFLSLSVKSTKWKFGGLYLGFTAWALSLLSHYDGIFIFPFVLYLVVCWLLSDLVSIRALFSTIKEKRANLVHVLYSVLLFTVLVLSFYIPFALKIDDKTQGYWMSRILGTGGKISSSVYLFNLYQPIYVFYIYILFFGFGVVSIVKDYLPVLAVVGLAKSKAKKILSYVLLFLNPRFYKIVALTLWFFIPFVFMEFFVVIPGTHIYTYLIPMSIFIGFGFRFFEDLFSLFFRKYHKFVIVPLFSVLFVFIFLQMYMIFVDHKREYPFEEERFLIWNMNVPSTSYHLSIFGFPYFRHWTEIGNLITTTHPTIPCPKNKQVSTCPYKLGKSMYFSTNERDSIVGKHIPYPKNEDNSGFYVYIENTQTFINELPHKKAAYFMDNYPPLIVFSTCGYTDEQNSTNYFLGLTKKCEMRELSKVYYMPSGKLEALLEFGF